MASDPANLPAPTSLKVAQICDLFLTTICPYQGPPPEKAPKVIDPQPPLKANATHEVRTYWWYRKYLQSFSDFFGTLNALDVKPFHVSRWLDAHPGWTTSRRCAVISCIPK